MRAALRTVGRRASRLVAVGAVAGAGIIASATAASAADPPWYLAPADGSWGAITLSGPFTHVDGDRYGPVTLTRHLDAADDPATVFESETLADGTVVWPAGGTAAGFTFERIDPPCAFTADSCDYYISGSTDPTDVSFVAGTEPSPGFFAANFPPTRIDLEEPPPPPPADPVVVGKVTVTYGADGTPNGATFDALDSSGPGGSAPGAYRWTLAPPPGGMASFECTTAQCPMPAGMTLEPGVTYQVQLELLDAPGGNVIGSSSNTAQLPIPNAPPPPPSGGGGGGAGAPNTPPANNPALPAEAPVVFANPVARAPASLGGGGAASAPTIVWLWRPEWFQPTIDAALPETSGRPKVKGSAKIVVSTAGPDGASAGPWLVGLGAFGLLGGGYLFNRFRRVRLLEI